MDLPHDSSSSPASNHIHDHSDHPDHRSRRRTANRSFRSQFPNANAPMAMAIPHRRQEEPPPPQPPPRYIADFDVGQDPGWAWGNRPDGNGFDKPNDSSASQLNFPKNWVSAMPESRPTEQLEYRRRQSSIMIPPTLRSPPIEPEPRHDYTRLHHDEGYYSVSGPGTLNQQLHGEKQLHFRDQQNSSQAYDNKLVSKIGKLNSPSRSSTFGSVESSPTSSLSFSQSGRQASNLRSLSFPNSAASTTSEPFIKREPSARFGDSPLSRPISPSAASSTRGSMDFRNPTFDQSARHSIPNSNMPSAPYSQHSSVLRQEHNRRSGILSFRDDSSFKNTTNEYAKPVKRESYDQAMSFSEHDSTFMEGVRHLDLEDHTPLRNPPDHAQHRYAEMPPSHSHLPKKRKAREDPSPDEAQKMDDPEAQLRADLQPLASLGEQQYHHQHNLPPHIPAHAANQFAQQVGSLQSQHPGAYHPNSYASGGPPVGGGSYDMDTHSPGEFSPGSEHYSQHLNTQDPQYLSSLAMNSIPHNSRAGPYPQPPQPLGPNKSSSTRRANEDRKNASMQSNFWRCNCCPKKPKKFDTEEELRQHENEKQHRCKFCNNRFKNKNEAERHQNSLHRRTHSWSCAVLGNSFDAVFFPFTSIQPPNPGPDPATQPPMNEAATTDVCGYCGEEFPNHPAADWEERGRHLSTKHKFGECNQSKKFYRADHFRQHLKHSHGGTSGKWTNALETACGRDEPQPNAHDSDGGPMSQSQSAPVANMGSMGPPNMVQSGMGQADMGHEHMSQQMGPQASMSEVQASLGPPDLPMDMIDPSIGGQGMDNMSNFAPQQHGGMQMHHPGAGQSQGYSELKDAADYHKMRNDEELKEEI